MPLELLGADVQLFVQQIIEVVDGHCRTESYVYRLQADESPSSWIVRWEYFRDPPRPDYPYPLAHVHVNGRLAAGQDLGRFHIPTRRVPLELVLWHVIAEWDVVPSGVMQGARATEHFVPNFVPDSSELHRTPPH